MSSDFHIICMSHDPAIRLEPEYASEPYATAEPALKAILDRTGAARMHKGCELILGRYSVSLVSVCCPRGESPGPTAMADAARGSLHPSFWHPHADEWDDVDWLRALWLAGPDAVYGGGRKSIGCWTWKRVDRLRFELNLGEGAE